MKLESIEELRVLAQVVESGSMVGASRALGMVPNTISRRIATLEDRVGVRLLNRTTRSVALSEHGRTMIGPIQRILAAVEAAEVVLQRDRSGLSGLVKMGVPSLLTADVLTAIRPLLMEHPELRVEVQVHDRPVNPVSAGLDVVIIGSLLQDSTLVARKLQEVQLVMVASETYLAEVGNPETLEDLVAHRTVHFRRSPPETSWTLTGDQGEHYTVPVEGCLEVDDGRALIDAMRAGLGIGMTSERLLRAHPVLRRVLPGYRGFRFPVYALYPASGERSARLRAVVSTLEEVLV